MKTKFSKFTKLFEGTDYGISHLEDLDVESFIRAVERLHKMEAVQKLDGANLRGGLDEKGRVYTSREQKGGKRFYAQKDFPKNSAYDGFRAAHEVLTKMTDVLESILAPGEAFNMEVIYGDQPNTVFYGKDGFNYLAILEMLPGDDPTHDPDQSKVGMIVDQMKGRTVTVKSDRSDTSDGENLVRVPTVTDWKITKSDHVPKDEIKEYNFDDEIKSLKKLLDNENAFAEKLGKYMSNFEVIKDRSPKLSEEKERLLQQIMDDYKMPIKKKLLDLVNKQKPSLRGSVGEEGAYNGIEGIIFTDPKTREKFKVVDKGVFSKINKFNYQVRNSIATKIMTNDPDAPMSSKGGIVGDARLRAIQLFGLGNADIPSQSKKILANFKGDSRDQTVKNIADSLHELHFNAAKRKLEAIYINALDDLDDALTAFKTSGDEYELNLDTGKKITYTPEIKRRTLMTFAEARKTLYSMISKIKKCSYIEDLIEVFFHMQLDALHAGMQDEEIQESLLEDDGGNAIVSGDTCLGNVASADSSLTGLYRMNKLASKNSKYVFRDNKIVKKRMKKFKVIKFKAPKHMKKLVNPVGDL
jgi:hypothetical protein